MARNKKFKERATAGAPRATPKKPRKPVQDLSKTQQHKGAPDKDVNRC
jgi:hypothetical protein